MKRSLNSKVRLLLITIVLFSTVIYQASAAASARKEKGSNKGKISK